MKEPGCTTCGRAQAVCDQNEGGCAGALFRAMTKARADLEAARANLSEAEGLLERINSNCILRPDVQHEMDAWLSRRKARSGT